jgi:hypothetical protein
MRAAGGLERVSQSVIYVLHVVTRSIFVVLLVVYFLD